MPKAFADQTIGFKNYMVCFADVPFYCYYFIQLSPDLSGETAVIVGHGNVALDIARILLSPLDLLKVCSTH